MSFYSEKEQTWEVLDLLDDKNTLRFGELQPNAIALDCQRQDASILDLLTSLRL